MPVLNSVTKDFEQMMIGFMRDPMGTMFYSEDPYESKGQRGETANWPIC